MKDKIPFGAWVKVSARLKRVTSKGKDGCLIREWISESIPEIEALFLGYRTISNGEVFYSYEADRSEYEVITYEKACLVCKAGNSKPFYAPLMAVEQINKWRVAR
jgi:hypothetical protein